MRRDRYREQVFATNTEKGIRNFGKSTSQKAVWANKRFTNGANGGIIREDDINKYVMSFSVI